MAYTGTTISWQANAETNRVYAIAIGEELTPPDASAIPLGGRMDWTDNSSGGTADGYEQVAVYLTDDDIGIDPVDEDGIEINPPTAPGIIALIRDKVGIRQINFTSYEIGAKLLQYATNMIEIDGEGEPLPGSDVWIETQEHTRVSVCIEWLGIGLLWLPSCEIKAMPPTGNVKKPGTQEVAIDVFCTEYLADGTTPRNVTYVWQQYAAA